MNTEWKNYFKKNRLDFLYQMNAEELEFLEENELIFNSILDIRFQTKTHIIQIKNGEFSHDLPFEPYEVIKIIDGYFFKLMNEKKISIQSEEEALVAQHAIKANVRYRFTRVYDPFFYALKATVLGLEKAKREFREDRGVNYQEFCNHVIHKFIAARISYSFARKHNNQMIV